MPPHPSLHRYLGRLAAMYGPSYLGTDPLGEVRRFRSPEDLEVAGFLASGLAFGRVSQILAGLRDLWPRLEGGPAQSADAWSGRRGNPLHGFQYRWVEGVDLGRVLAALGRVRRAHGSLREALLAHYDPTAADLSGALTAFVREIRGEVAGPVSLGVGSFLADPARGGACKRLNLYLRWMVRSDDGVDLGLFAPIRPDQLVIPLDTHVARISRYLGLSERRTVDWKMAAEVTASLRRIDPLDPVRFDFALSRLGILEACPRRVDAERCRGCTLLPACTLGQDQSGRAR